MLCKIDTLSFLQHGHLSSAAIFSERNGGGNVQQCFYSHSTVVQIVLLAIVCVSVPLLLSRLFACAMCDYWPTITGGADDDDVVGS